MSVHNPLDRRQFAKCTASVLAAATVAQSGTASTAMAQESATTSETPPPQSVPSESGAPSPTNRGRIYKSVKWGMVGGNGSVLEKFVLQKELGFDGIEMNSPQDVDLDEAVAASKETGMPIHGVVDSVHWNQRLSSPDASVRDAGREALAQAIRDAHYLGGDAVLLVPGRVASPNESHDDVWSRSIVEIRKVLPIASKLGVRVLIENVWNGFCEKPEQLRDYLDEIASPWVGSYFDIGNHQKFSPPANWIRVLRHRIVKLDVKDWGIQNGFCKIGDGDVDWADVRSALGEIDFTGWCTAEVAGGNRERLADVAQRMNHVLALG